MKNKAISYIFWIGLALVIAFLCFIYLYDSLQTNQLEAKVQQYKEKRLIQDISCKKKNRWNSVVLSASWFNLPEEEKLEIASTCRSYCNAKKDGWGTLELYKFTTEEKQYSNENHIASFGKYGFNFYDK